MKFKYVFVLKLYLYVLVWRYIYSSIYLSLYMYVSVEMIYILEPHSTFQWIKNTGRNIYIINPGNHSAFFL